MGSRSLPGRPVGCRAREGGEIEMGSPHLVVAALLALGQCIRASPNPKQRFLTEPKSTSVLEGKDLVLECSITDQVGELQWTRDDFGLGTDREPCPAPYYPEPRPPTKSPTSSASCSSPAYGNLGVHSHSDGIGHRHDTGGHSHDASWVRGFTTD